MSHIFYDEISDRYVPVPKEGNPYKNGGKRAFDLFIVLLAALIILPIIGFVWAVTYASGGKGFYHQQRVGKGGKIFRCWKIRTMTPDADKVLALTLKENPSAALEWNRSQKLTNDPRITRFGRFLRASSIDELPQFWNILKGEMSLIGPRPFTLEQKSLYDEVSDRDAYYGMRPGLSGLWQVSSRSTGRFQDRVVYDEEYADNISFWYDLKILLRTVGVILKATGK